jgi:hypothetical protein
MEYHLCGEYTHLFGSPAACYCTARDVLVQSCMGPAYDNLTLLLNFKSDSEIFLEIKGAHEDVCITSRDCILPT